MNRPPGTPQKPKEPAPYPNFDGTQACLDAADPDLFFEDAGDTSDLFMRYPAAFRFCRRCPFVEACLAYALTHNVRGVWGGTSYAERKRIRSEHGIVPLPLALERAETSAARLAVRDPDAVATEIAAATGVSTRTVARIRTRKAVLPS